MKRITKRKTTSATVISPLTIGRALVILATSCAALSPTPPQLRSVQSLSSRSRRRNSDSGESYSSGLATLRYRNGGEEQLSADGSGVVSEPQHPTRAVLMVPQLFITLFRLPVIVAPSLQMRSIPSPPSRDQLVMDEYLEFIERRYSRMHPKPQHTVIDFHPAAWGVLQHLFSGPTISAAPHGAQHTEESPLQHQDSSHEDVEEDPLNVLGLSDLASAELRQRLHVAVAAVGGRTSSYVSLSFPAQLRLLFSTLRRVAFMSVYSTRILAAFFGRVASQIATKGGFRNSGALRLIVVMVCLVNMIRSLHSNLP